MVDTNSDPREVDYVIPANDDASKSIEKILTLVTAAVIDGASNRSADAKEGEFSDVSEEAEVAPVAEAVAPAVEVVAEVEVAPVAEVEAAPVAEVEETPAVEETKTEE